MPANTAIQHKRSSVPGKIPTVNQLVDGELSVNTHDGKIYFRKNANGVMSIVDVANNTGNENVLYVSKSGNNSFDGKTLTKTFLTIKAALEVAMPGTTIFVKSGDYTENNPLIVPSDVSIVGDNLRSTTVRPANVDQDIFSVNSGCYITGLTFKDHVSPAAAIAFPTAGAGLIIKSPYVQNCTSMTTTGTGMRIDGSKALGLKSMVSDAFTQINSGGIGVHILNSGYAQLVSIFTVFCDVAIFCESGGQCSVTNSNSSFGNYGLKATGVSAKLYDGTMYGSTSKGLSTFVVRNLIMRPRYGDAIRFGNSGRYYTVLESTAIDISSPYGADGSLVTIDVPLEIDISNSTSVSFYQRSLITSSGHTFEYVGTGTDTPASGAFPIQENEIVDDSNQGGKVFFTSTDQMGDFRVGSELIFNRASGTITGDTFDRSLFAVLTPYILAIES